MNTKNYIWIAILSLCLLALAHTPLEAQTTEFTYQGRLLDSGFAPTATYDMQFSLFDDAATGNQKGQTITVSGVSVSNGIFTVHLDFGSQFAGDACYLQIGIRPAGGPNIFTALNPRQPLTSAPYSVRSLEAATADLAQNSDQLGGIPANGFVHNGTTPQAGTDFNISGSGTLGGPLSADAVNSATQYNIAGSRVLGADSNANTFVGLFAGLSNTTGSTDTFVGYFAGKSNTTGFNNSYVGWAAGAQGSTASNNAFFGTGAGAQNTASFNSFFGSTAGNQNTTGTGNAFFGSAAGTANTVGGSNSFFGGSAGAANSIGHDNTFLGYNAGINNTGGPALNNGDFNTFVGSRSGASNVTGWDNSFFGYNSGYANTDGAGNAYFGYETGESNLTSCCNSFFGYRAGKLTIAGANSFFGDNSGVQNTTGTYNAFFGFNAGSETTTGSQNSFFGTDAGNANKAGTNNSFFGSNSGLYTEGNNNSGLGVLASTNAAVNNGTAIGAHSYVTQNDSIVLGSINGVNGAAADTKVGIGTTAPKAPLHIAGSNTNVLIGSVTAGCAPGYAGIGFGSSLNCLNVSLVGNGTDTTINRPTGGSIYFMQNAVPEAGISPAGDLSVNNKISVGVLGTAGSTALCRNASNQISTCSSSLRYKKDLQPFTRGLALLDQLKPITFKWKADNSLDLGFGAEDIAKVEPLLVTHNDKGEVEGVKYDRISAVLVNAVKEQQDQIGSLRKEVEQQRLLIDDLKKLVCQINPQASACK